MHQWYFVSWNDVNVRHGDTDMNLFVHAWRKENFLKIVLHHPMSKKFALK